MTYKKVIAVDFDGTICASEYPKLGKRIKGAKKYINKLHDDGFGIVINTCRTQIPSAKAIKWLKKEGINYDYFNCNVPERIEYFGMDCRKISADVYVDDKQVGELPPWKEIYKFIKNKYNETA